MNLQDLKESLSKEAYGMTAAEAIQKRICIKCRKPPTFYSEAGKREYQITGLCEPCFDQIAEEPEE